MHFFPELAKALGKGILILLSIPAFFLLLLFLPEFCKKRTDSTTLIQSQSFQKLHHLVSQLDSTRSIAVLPENDYVVVDGLVINLVKRTFGYEPELGFYQTYYEEGSKYKFLAIDSLLKPHHLDSIKVYRITGAMKSNDIADVIIKPTAILYRWKVSAMYGEEGVLYSRKKVSQDSLHYKLFEDIGSDFYHFAR